MVRSLIIIALAIVCGAAAAIGVLRSQPKSQSVDIVRKPVYVASRRIARGERIRPEMIRKVDWPEIPGEDVGSEDGGLRADVIRNQEDALDRVALATIMSGEPLFDAKLADEKGEGFIASSIETNMRAKTIETRGPAASVAGFVRPEDRVDVLLNIRGNAGDNTGGSISTTLLQNVKVVAIDQVLDPEVDTMQMLEKWAKGDEPTSVTLEVTPAQALLLDVGENYGDLSLSLRRLGDARDIPTPPATIQDIQALRQYLERADQMDRQSRTPGSEPPAEPSGLAGLPEWAPPPRPTFIQAIRGSTSSRIELEPRVTQSN